MSAKLKWLALAFSLFFLITSGSTSFSLDRQMLLFYSSLDGKVDADLARGEAEALPGYKRAFAEGVRGQAVVVGKESGLIKTLEAPISFWLDIDIPVNYVDEFIGALRYSQPQNLRWQEGTLSFWVKPLDWRSGDGRDHYLVHLDMEDTLSFVWAPYPGWLEFRQSRISDRDVYKKFSTYPGINADAWQNVTVSWRGKEQWTYVDGRLSGHVFEGVPGYTGGGKYIALGDAQEFHSAFDELLVLAQAITETDAEALYRRAKEPGLRPLISIPETPSGIKIDASVKKSEYLRAAKLTGWTDSILGVANNDPTFVYLTYDERNLYVSFVFPVPDKYRVNPVEYVNQPVKMKAKGRDADLFGDDYFEVKLIPGGTNDRYRLAVNAAGAKFDSKNGDKSWNGTWKAQSYFDDYFWKVELAFPFSTFGRAAPSVGETWQMNLVHQAVQVTEMGSVWAYGGPDPKPMGTLTFGGTLPAIHLDRAGNPGSGAIDIEASVNAGRLKAAERWSFDTVVSAVALGELDEAMKNLEAEAPREYAEKKELSLEPGKTLKIKVEHTLEKPLAADLVIFVKNKEGKNVLVHRMPFAFSVATSMDVRMLPSLNRVLVELDAGAISAIKKGVSAEITIFDKSEKPVKRRSLIKMKSVKQVVEIDAAALPAGKYSAVAKLSAAGKPMPEMKKDFEIKPKPEWLGAKVGISEEVMSPWTPLQSDDASISCWGRTYTYGDSVFPAKIEVLGKEILASPMVINIKEDGKSRSVSADRIAFQSKKPNRIEYRVSGSAGSFDVKTENWIEYDGLIWVKLIVTPEQKGARMEEMTLEVPYNKEIATHWYNGQYRPDSATGYLPGKKYVGPAANFARFGDAERGLQWVWEHRYGCRISNKKEAMELIPGEDAYRVKLKFVDHEITLDEPIEIEIGLQALPNRSQPKGYHGPYWGGGGSRIRPTLKFKEIPVINLWYHRWYLWNYMNLTQEQLEWGRKRVVKGWQQFKEIGCIYSNHITTSPMSPEYRYYYDEWRVVPSSKPNFAALDAMDIDKARKSHAAHICYGSESYSDFYMYYLQKALKYFHEGDGTGPKVPIGLYYDNSGAASCGNRYHGHGVLVDGEYKPVKAILAWRRANERIRRIMKGITERSWFTVHMSGQPIVAYWSYNDIMIPGEQYAAFFHMKKAQADAEGKPWPYDYTLMTELDRVRAEYSSQGYGPAQVFLSEIWNFASKRPPEEQAKARRHLFGMLFVNDVMSWGNDSAKTPVLNALWEHLGWDDKVVFIPYWRNQQYLNMQPYDENKIVASIYEREGKIAIFAFNNTDKNVQASRNRRCRLRKRKARRADFKQGIQIKRNKSNRAASAEGLPDIFS